MSASIAAQVLALESMNVAQLRVRWNKVFGEETKQRHRRYLIRRLAWKLQEDQLPKLTPEQEARVAEYQREYEAMPPEKWFPNAGRGRKARAAQKPPGSPQNRRLPKPGSLITRDWKGRQVAVKVLDKGFEYQGRVYRSLSGVAREVTGTSWNGWKFFGVDGEARR
ncbi:MAG: DUF2924 domain-containing protein [Candidatus Krumholzibacteriia bacterium]